MAVMLREAFDWLKPSPLWDGGLAGARSPDFFQPQVFGFNHDNFVNAFRDAVGASDSTPLKSALIASASAPVKLFQAAHGWFYLVSAELCCRMLGFPDRVVQRVDGESVFFVMRKFVDNAEYGWVADSQSWQPLNGQPRRVLDGEQRQPLFPATGVDNRTVLFGYIPVASSQVYSVPATQLYAQMTPDEQSLFPNGIDLRIEELEARFTTPLNRYPSETTNSPPNQTTRTQAISVYLVLDLWEFFETYLPDVATALRDDPTTVFTGPQAAAEQQLMAFLASKPLSSGSTLAAALGAVAKQRDGLEAAGADPTQLGFSGYDLSQIDLNALEDVVRQALPPDPNQAVKLPQVSASTAETYAVRCVYERPQCSPPMQVVSQLSATFQLATFFDGDAPARPVRIVLPTDVSLAGMRKFQKGVTFVISGALNQKIGMITGQEKQLITGSPSPTPGLDVGWICSFSIQIIFIVAFFLLLMFVIILNLVFWWIAFFKICFPIPKKLLTG
jgi:hypothetical protein